jgi:hypothetical protein
VPVSVRSPAFVERFHRVGGQEAKPAEREDHGAHRHVRLRGGTNAVALTASDHGSPNVALGAALAKELARRSPDAYSWRVFDASSVDVGPGFGSTVSDSAMVAQLVPAAEIHWSVP